MQNKLSLNVGGLGESVVAKPCWHYWHNNIRWIDISHILNELKKMTGDILFLVWHLLLLACLMFEHSEMVITLQKTLECLKYCFNTHTHTHTSFHYNPCGSKIISLHVEIKYLYFDMCGQAVGWIQESIWDAEIRLFLREQCFYSTWGWICPEKYSCKNTYGENNVKLEKELHFLLVDTNAQWNGWEINRDIFGLCFLCSLMWPQHECRCAAWELVFYAFHTCRDLAELKNVNTSMEL